MHGKRYADMARRLAWLLLGLILVGGCTPMGPQSTLDPHGPVARMQLDVFMITVWVCVGAFLATSGLLVCAIWRFRARPGNTEAPLARSHGNPAIEFSLIGIMALLLLLIAIPNLRALFAASTPPPGADVLRLEITGKQWWWKFAYPGLGIETANELHIPAGRVVQAQLRSEDVIHSFWVPKLAGKMDVIPNKVNRMWFSADEPGTYFGQCAEFCGVSHANMRFRVVVHPAAEFDAWVRAQQQPAQPMADNKALEGAQVFRQKGCMACHAIAGTPARGEVGPNLTHVGSRHTLAAGLLENSPRNLARWLRNPQDVKPGSRMPNLGLSNAEITALVAYLQDLK